MDIIDVIITLLFMVSAFLVPKLWKEYMLKVKQALQVTNQGEARPDLGSMVVKEEFPELAHDSSTQVATIVASNVAPVVKERAVWQGKMNANAVINGMIFAEIVQPPRAYRPFVRRK